MSCCKLKTDTEGFHYESRYRNLFTATFFIIVEFSLIFSVIVAISAFLSRIIINGIDSIFKSRDFIKSLHGIEFNNIYLSIVAHAFPEWTNFVIFVFCIFLQSLFIVFSAIYARRLFHLNSPELRFSYKLLHDDSMGFVVLLKIERLWVSEWLARIIPCLLPKDFSEIKISLDVMSYDGGNYVLSAFNKAEFQNFSFGIHPANKSMKTKIKMPCKDIKSHAGSNVGDVIISYTYSTLIFGTKRGGSLFFSCTDVDSINNLIENKVL